MRGPFTRAATKAGFILATLGLATTAATTTAAAQPAQEIDRETVVLPLSGTFGALFSEPIDITGSVRVRVVTDPEPGGGGTARVTSTLLNTTGIGEVSGDSYRFVGSDTNEVTYPPGPVTPLTFRPTFFKVFPPGPVVPPNPILPPHPVQPVIVDVSLAPDGAIEGISARVDPGLFDNP
ncbi:hypothetical protein AB0D99_28215 [Streptomyces sp. NPDC047971]|uniref:hypothetical protein n=1 Tax=Streptomyces sp. NPDC047971 TaxID=3154499 RepID=UPI0033E6BB9E